MHLLCYYEYFGKNFLRSDQKCWRIYVWCGVPSYRYAATHTRIALTYPSVARWRLRLSRHRTDNNGALSNLVDNVAGVYFVPYNVLLLF